MFIHFHAASLPSCFMFGKSSRKTNHFLWSTLSTIWFTLLQVSKRANKHHQSTMNRCQFSPTIFSRKDGAPSAPTNWQKHWSTKSGKPLRPGSSPLTWDQLSIVTSKSSKICDSNPSQFRSRPYFFNVYHFLGTNHVRFIHITVSCHDLPEHGRKTPKHKW